MNTVNCCMFLSIFYAVLLVKITFEISSEAEYAVNSPPVIEGCVPFTIRTSVNCEVSNDPHTKNQFEIKHIKRCTFFVRTYYYFWSKNE